MRTLRLSREDILLVLAHSLAQTQSIYDYEKEDRMTSSPIQPGTNYTVQQNDNLTTIAQRAYGDGNLWPKIYNYPANKQVIGNDPNYILPGEVLYIPLPITTCTVTAANGLRVRAAPNTQSAIIATYPSGTVLNFVEVVSGENVNGNPNWGHSEQGHYFWLGGTDHPNG